MNRVLLGVFLVIIGLNPTVADGQRVQTMDAPIDEFVLQNPLPACGIRTAVAHLAKAAGIRIGFESTFECWGQVVKFERAKSQVFVGLTARQILDRVVALTPPYRWRDMNGVAVVRSSAAWDDAHNVLSLPSEPFAALDVSPNMALRLVLRTSQPGLDRVEDRPSNETLPLERHLSVTFSGGTLLEALNAVIAATRGLGWQVMYNGRSLKERDPRLSDSVGVGLTTFAAADVTTFENGESSFYAGGFSFWMPRSLWRSGR